jgi:hypothetical protein
VRYDITLMQLTTKLTQREGEGAVEGDGAASNATTTSVPQALDPRFYLDSAGLQDRIRADLGEVGG